MSEQEKPDAAAEIRRIHAMITQALDESLERSEHFAQAGFPDAETRQALVGYVGCFGGMLHAHHLSEDEFVFPYFRERMSDAPFDDLMAQHRKMEPLLKDIQAACGTLSGDGEGSEATWALYSTLDRLSVLWYPHIELEEVQFTREGLDVLWNAQEEAQFVKGIEKYMQQHVNPEEMQRCEAILYGAE